MFFIDIINAKYLRAINNIYRGVEQGDKSEVVELVGG